MNRIRVKSLRCLRNQAGLTLFEVLVAVSILGFIGASIALAVSTSHKSTGVMDEQVTAMNIATSCVEALNAADFSDSYSIEDSTFDGVDIAQNYSVVFDTECTTDGENFTSCNGSQTLQKIQVNVYMGNKRILYLCTFKSDF
jgi:Tfp pilus assembly protein PilV